MPACILKAHPDTPSAAISGVHVNLSLDSSLRLAYRMVGDLSGIVIPAASLPMRRDELWRHTCCEVFVKDAASLSYMEFNFAPSRAWAAYRFDDYRAGMRPIEMTPPTIDIAQSADTCTLEVSMPRAVLGAPTPQLKFAISCVIEATDGSRSYWALHHPAGKPDFHHADAFALSVSCE